MAVEVDLDAAGAAESEARLSCEFRLGTDADGEQNEAARDVRAVRELGLPAYGSAYLGVD